MYILLKRIPTISKPFSFSFNREIKSNQIGQIFCALFFSLTIFCSIINFHSKITSQKINFSFCFHSVFFLNSFLQTDK